MTLKLSKDGSHVYGSASQHFLGEEGAFCVPVIRRRCGQAQRINVHGEISSPIRVDILAAAAEVSREAD